MRRVSLVVVAIAVAVAGIVLSSSLFVVHQIEQALVLQFGQPVRVVDKPGLYLKVPFIQNVVTFDARVLDFDPPSEQMILSDQRRIMVDSFARYRITNPLLYYQSARTEGFFVDQFGRILNSSVRGMLASTDLVMLLSDKRADIMHMIRETVAQEVKSYGIELVDVRIGRTELPEEVLNTVYQRMRSEREREANLLRAEGEENARRIRATADRDRTVIVAEADRQSAILRGEGDAVRNRVLGEAYGRDREFFDFYRTLDAYRATFLTEGTTLVLTPDSEFFRYFTYGEMGGAPGEAVVRPPVAVR